MLDFRFAGILPAALITICDIPGEGRNDYSVGLKQAQIDMLYDPQTFWRSSLAVKEPELERLQYQLGEKGCENAVIGSWLAHIALH